MPQRILITGATSAIGSALAREYAAPKVTLILHGRRLDVLDQVAADCIAQGAKVQLHALDVRDGAALQAWLEELEALDLVIINAGMNTHIGPQGQAEPWDQVEALLAVNLQASMRIAQAVLPAMRVRGRGQIAFMSSLAGYFGLPVTPSYSASKAGIKAYGEALRGWLAPEGIQINVVMPGYVRSPMCDAMPGPKPWLWPPQRAARAIVRGLARNRARISFPFPLDLGTWCLAVLPAAVSHRIVRWMGYGA
ncbi:SDR family NAD(P)-dependent oxidoreductase [Castellaniella sp.]|uniref:SDR family NAD(P)-dependent oxidoreductase n=1 Tax=Castellaniella sp. TaxID=1955812 RepID=UPI002AFFBCFA|nr:SDR family NAD(P)-dependent oxidoreductase [Castellaniella sp.]